MTVFIQRAAGSPRVSPEVIALVALAAAIVLPALFGFAAPVHEREDWRGNGASLVVATGPDVIR
jgi:hypothetical protein